MKSHSCTSVSKKKQENIVVVKETQHCDVNIGFFYITHGEILYLPPIWCDARLRLMQKESLHRTVRRRRPFEISEKAQMAEAPFQSQTAFSGGALHMALSNDHLHLLSHTDKKNAISTVSLKILQCISAVQIEGLRISYSKPTPYIKKKKIIPIKRRCAEQDGKFNVCLKICGWNQHKRVSLSRHTLDTIFFWWKENVPELDLAELLGLKMRLYYSLHTSVFSFLLCLLMQLAVALFFLQTNIIISNCYFIVAQCPVGGRINRSIVSFLRPHLCFINRNVPYSVREQCIIDLSLCRAHISMKLVWSRKWYALQSHFYTFLCFSVSKSFIDMALHISSNAL